MAPAQPISGGVRARTRDCQGVEASWPLSLPLKSTQQETKDQTMSGFEGELGEAEAEAEAQRRGGTCDRRTPQGATGICAQSKIGKGGRSQSQELQQTQAHGAGRKDKRWRRAGDGCRQCPGERRFTPGEEVGRG